MIPDKIYEVLPYAYVAVGSAVMLATNAWLLVVCGFLMVCAGAVVWVLRSDNRRSDIKAASSKYGGVLPFWCYELLPFSYFMLALLLFALSNNIYFYPSAMILLVIGMQLWLLRGSYRKHQRPVLHTRPLRSRG
jgi:4-hydroxybenzoate polyprenyltransferase